MGKQGQGRGGLAPEEQTAVDFKTERTKVATTKGAIIGEYLIEGEQVRGDAKSSMSETVIAGEREASDLIHRDRIPRQYHKAIKGYFSNLKGSEAKGSSDSAGNSKTSDNPSKEGSDGS